MAILERNSTSAEEEWANGCNVTEAVDYYLQQEQDKLVRERQEQECFQRGRDCDVCLDVCTCCCCSTPSPSPSRSTDFNSEAGCDPSDDFSDTGPYYDLAPYPLRKDCDYSARYPPPDSDQSHKLVLLGWSGQRAPKVNKQVQYDTLNELFHAIPRKCWADIDDDDEQLELRELSSSILRAMDDKTFHLYDVPCIGPVDGTNLKHLVDATAKLGLCPARRIAHQRHWMDRNGLYQECARNRAYNLDRGSGGFPCSPCQTYDAVCYYEQCRFGNRCKRDRCPWLHPIVILLLASALAKMGIPTDEASQMADHWMELHTWDLPLCAYHFDTDAAGMFESTQLPPRGSALIRPDTPTEEHAQVHCDGSSNYDGSESAAQEDEAKAKNDLFRELRHYLFEQTSSDHTPPAGAEATPNLDAIDSRPQFNRGHNIPDLLRQGTPQGSASNFRRQPQVVSREDGRGHDPPRNDRTSYGVTDSFAFSVSGGRTKFRGSGKAWKYRG